MLKRRASLLHFTVEKTSKIAFGTKKDVCLSSMLIKTSEGQFYIIVETSEADFRIHAFYHRLISPKYIVV